MTKNGGRGEASTDGLHTRALAGFVSKMRYEDLSDELVRATKRLLIDSLGCIVAARETEIGPVIADLSGMISAGTQRHPLAMAYGFGRLANALDFEEGVPSGTHFGCGAIGASLAVSTMRRVRGAEFLTALAVGYEVGGRIGDAIGPYFRTSKGAAKSFAQVWGAMTPVVFAATGSAANMLGYDARHVAQSFGLAGSNTPIPIGAKWAAEHDPPNTKYGDTGWCTLAGVFGALAAGSGSTAIGTLLDGRDGLYPMVAAQDPHPEIVSADLGTRWRLDQILFKQWPCCRWIHYPLTALTRLIDRHKIAARDVRRVTVRVGFAATSHRFSTPDPSSFAAYQFSIPHAVAMVLLGIAPGPAWFAPEIVAHPQLARLRRTVHVETHPREWQFADFRFAASGAVRRLPASVVVQTDTETYEEETEFAFGDSYCTETRWGDSEVEAKFRNLVEASSADRILETIERLETIGDVTILLDLIEAAKANQGPSSAHIERVFGALSTDEARK